MKKCWILTTHFFQPILATLPVTLF